MMAFLGFQSVLAKARLQRAVVRRPLGDFPGRTAVPLRVTQKAHKGVAAFPDSDGFEGVPSEAKRALITMEKKSEAKDSGTKGG